MAEERKTGPRETRLREHLATVLGMTIADVLDGSPGWRSDLREARLADALEEALAVCSVEGRIRGSSSESMRTIARLQEVLAEVDRGSAAQR